MVNRDRRFARNPEERRTQAIRIMLTPRELERVYRNADAEGITISEYVRRALNIGHRGNNPGDGLQL